MTLVLLEGGVVLGFDRPVLNNVVDELKKAEVNRELVRWLLTRTDIDQMRSAHT